MQWAIEHEKTYFGYRRDNHRCEIYVGTRTSPSEDDPEIEDGEDWQCNEENPNFQNATNQPWGVYTVYCETFGPTETPTEFMPPTVNPTLEPTDNPLISPFPTRVPSMRPTNSPSKSPTMSPTLAPSECLSDVCSLCRCDGDSGTRETHELDPELELSEAVEECATIARGLRDSNPSVVYFSVREDDNKCEIPTVNVAANCAQNADEGGMFATGRNWSTYSLQCSERRRLRQKL